jgi:hypothetical protein
MRLRQWFLPKYKTPLGVAITVVDLWMRCDWALSNWSNMVSVCLLVKRKVARIAQLRSREIDLCE